MRDYTFNGTPVADMGTSDIHDCLRDGVEVLSSDGESDPGGVVRERLLLELQIRSFGLRK